MSEANGANGHAEAAVPLDALPYIDLQFGEAEIRQQVDQLIEAELARIPQPEMPAQSEFKFSSELLQAEFDRVSSGSLLSFDTSRYAVQPPSDEAKDDPKAWRQAVERAQIQVEFENSKLENLELINRFGGNAWRLHVESLQLLKTSMANGLDSLRRGIDDTNRKRKADQLAAGAELYRMEQQWLEQITKNAAIERACSQIEAEIKRLKSIAVSKGLLKDETAEPAAAIKETEAT